MPKAGRMATTSAVSIAKWSFQNGIRQTCMPGASGRNFSSILVQSETLATILKGMRTTSISTNEKRNLTKYSMTNGKRKSVKPVLRRFYRLNWGIWIRTICGRHKKLWKKSPARKRRLRQHVFCNATQSYMLDKMVGNFWRKPKYYIEDPYEPYHTREEFKFTYTKPRSYVPLEKK